jgi:hypothetical protein
LPSDGNEEEMAREETVRVLRATTVEHYHKIPNELELLTASPEQSAIFQYLAEVDPDRFEEFVGDVLVHVEGHKLIEVTGGPGDEKQDILSETPDGHRQLTQCKHTINFSGRSSGEGLDQMLGAALRKNCKEALYVTNGDLTPQAKRYVNDKEYQRGSFVDPSAIPNIEYWNGRRIWERIANSASILNKWFSGAAQVHGLRSVNLRLIATEMPDRQVRSCDPRSVEAAFSSLQTPFTLSADSWFSSFRDVPGSAGQLPLDAPVSAIRAQVTARPGNESFDLDLAVSHVASAALSSLGNATGWFHQFVSAPSAVFFLHDLHRPLTCEVGNARSLVKVGNDIEDEFTWSFDPGEGFVRSGEDELSWVHVATGAGWSANVVQPIGPSDAYGMVLRQQRLIESAAAYEFRRFRSSPRILELLQSVATLEAMIMQEVVGEEEYLLFALPMPDRERTAARLDEYCSRNEVSYEILDADQRQRLLSLIEELPVSSAKLVSQVNELQSPIDLEARFFTLHGGMRLRGKMPPLIRLLTYKWEYEVKWGFDALMGQEKTTIGSEEIRGRLFDIQTNRGSHMLDIGEQEDGGLLLFFRRTVDSTSRASEIAAELLDEFRRVEEQVNSLEVE